MMRPSFLTAPKTIIEDGHLACVTAETSVELVQSYLSFLLVTVWP